MKKIILILITTLTFSNLYSKTTITAPQKIIVINGKLYKEKNGVFTPLLGIAIKWVAPIIIGELKELAINYMNDYFKEKNIKVLDESQGTREDVEVITINIEDTDNDGNLEFSSESEDNNNDGLDDNETESVEFQNYENGLEQVLNNQLEYIDQYFQGDIDGDGTEE